MISVMPGIMKVMVRLVNSWVFIRSRLASSNRASSNFSRLNARIGMMPVRISRLTRFSRSTSFCIFLKRGIATCISTNTRQSSSATASTMIQDRPVSVPATRTMPPMPRIGA